MNICLLGEYTGNLDEGMRKVSFHFAKKLSENHHILTVDLRHAGSRQFWKKIRDFDPDIIHYLHGPSIKSFVFTKFISIFHKDAKVVMSAMRPVIPYMFKVVIPLLKPDIMLTLSPETEQMFTRFRCKTEFLPLGVDLEKFKPVTDKLKKELRRKYGLENDKFIILHVGSIKEGRNILLLKKLQISNEYQVLIVGSSSTGIDAAIKEDLIRSGCVVWTEYIKNIEEIYALSDCYIYPTVAKYDQWGRAIANSIELPLSVLEAMACNLPVISTRFGALPKLFDDRNGLFFFDDTNEIENILENMICDIAVNTRKNVLPYSWNNIIKKLEKIYLDLIN